MGLESEELMADANDSLAEGERRLRDLADRYKDKTATLRYEEMNRPGESEDFLV